MNEAVYLAKFREVRRLRSRIELMIGEFRAVCKSLESWQKIASELGAHAGLSRHPEWSDERLKGLLELRGLLMTFDAQKEEASRLWNQLSADEKTGLCEPGALIA